MPKGHVTMLRRDKLQLWPVSEVELGLPPVQMRDSLKTIVQWSATFLVPEHPDLGRDGPVCPFTRTSMDRGLFYLSHLRTDSNASLLREAVSAFREWYLDMAETLNEKQRKFLTFLIVLEDIDLTDSRELDDLQRSLKDSFVEQGLMIGQFHPKCDQPGLWNDDFRPLRSPIPLLAIRIMVPGDLPFLTGSDVHLAAYFARFAAGIPSELRIQLAIAMGRDDSGDRVKIDGAR